MFNPFQASAPLLNIRKPLVFGCIREYKNGLVDEKS